LPSWLSLCSVPLGLVTEWASSHQNEPIEDWNLAQAQAPLKPVEPPRETMLKDLVEVRPLGRYRVHLRFEDGVEGEFKGIFAPVRDAQEFA